MATIMAAIVAKSRRDIQHLFFSRDAVRPERAIAFEASRPIERRQFEWMRKRGVIREASPGKYWLNAIDYDIDLRRRHAAVRTALLIVVAILAAALLLGVRLG